MDMKSTKDLIQMLDFGETEDQLAKANGVRWHGHALKKDENSFMRSALSFRVKWTRKRVDLLRAVIEQSRNVGQNESDANNHSRWRLRDNTISSMMK